MRYPTNFEFNGMNAGCLGYGIVSFDGAKNGEQDYGDKITYNTSKAAQSPQIRIHGSHTEEPMTFQFQIARLNSRSWIPEPIRPSEQAFLKRWLERSDGYKYLRFLDGPAAGIYYYCTIQLKWHMIHSVVYGATLYVTCDSDHAYSDIQSFSIENFQTGDSVRLLNDSDTNGVLPLMEIEIVALEKGTLHLTNRMDELYYYNTMGMEIPRCDKNECITVNGLMNTIATNNSSHTSTLMEDYNFNPLHLINLDDSVMSQHSQDTWLDQRVNVIKNLGVPCNLNIAYRTIRTGVI